MVGPHAPLQWAWQPEPADRSRHTGGGHLPPALRPERGCPHPWPDGSTARSTRQRQQGDSRNTWKSPVFAPSQVGRSCSPQWEERGRGDSPHTYIGTHAHTHAHTLMPRLQALRFGLQILAISQGERWARRRKRWGQGYKAWGWGQGVPCSEVTCKFKLCRKVSKRQDSLCP